MKKLLLILLFLFYQHVSSQAYTPLLSDFNEWQFTTCYFGCFTDVYYTDGDTLVNGKSYKVLDGYHYINRNLLLREEIAEKKVYLTVTQPQYEEDILLYDFSLTEGDSITMRNPLTPFPNNGGYFTLDSIRMLTQSNGIENRHFYFTPSTSNSTYITKTEWIEGVGSASMINAPAGEPNFNGVGKLSCAFQNASLFYSDLTSISSCEPLVLSISETTIKETKIQLLPTNYSQQYILSPRDAIKEVKVFALNGKLHHHKVTQLDTELLLDLEQASPGLYLIKVVLTNNQHKTLKVVVP